jgi:hypothetical protein
VFISSKSPHTLFEPGVNSLAEPDFEPKYTRRIRLLTYKPTQIEKFETRKQRDKQTDKDLQLANLTFGLSGVRYVSRQRGYREVFNSNDWDVLWTLGSQYHYASMPALKPHQRCNICHGYNGIAGNKVTQWKLYKYMQDTFGKEDFNFLPTSYVLPQQRHTLQSVIRAGNEQTWYIAKPERLSRARGIFLFQKERDIPDKPYLAQEYLHRPFLIENRKFHLRLYLLISSLTPLRVYLHREGFALFSADTYRPEDMTNMFSHLTNWAVGLQAVNKSSWQPETNDTTHLAWTLSYFLQYMEHTRRTDIFRMKQKISDVLVKSVLSLQGKRPFVSRPPGTCFDVYGADVMFDEHLNPILAEINSGPDLAVGDETDLVDRIHAQVIHDILDFTVFKPTQANHPEFRNM